MARIDAQRNIDALLDAAKAEFAAQGVDVNVRAIAARAGVGTATLYRHFPQRSDLISAVFRREIDDCANAAEELSGSEKPMQALELWIQRYTQFISTKQGLAGALHSGNPIYFPLATYFSDHLAPALAVLLHNAAAIGAIGEAVDAEDLLGAIANLCVPAPGTRDISTAHRMVAVLLDGLRYRAIPAAQRSSSG